MITMFPTSERVSTRLGDLNATASATTQAEAAARLAPHAWSVIIEGTRTLVPLEQPEALATASLAFWRKVDGED